MTFQRFAILVGVLVAVAIGVRILVAQIPPLAGELRAHSYSGLVVGHRALFELTEHFGHDAQRWRAAPERLFEGDRRVLLINPSIPALELEKRYLIKMDEWIQAGGEVVLVADELDVHRVLGAPPGAGNGDGDEEEEDERPPWDAESFLLEEYIGEPELLARLGVSNLRVTDGPGPSGLGPLISGSQRAERFQTDRFVRDRLEDARLAEEAYEARFTGAFEHLDGAAETLSLPAARVRHLQGGGLEDAVGRIEVLLDRNGNGEPDAVPIAAMFAHGAGHSVIVSEPALVNNLGLTQEDNAVAAYHLAVGGGGREIVFDEYYLGNMRVDSAFALVGMYPFSVIVLSVLAAAGVWARFAGVQFGAPIPPRAASRRSIGEYVDAMARLFYRGRKARYALSICRDGVLDEIREELLLPHGSKEGAILGRLARMDPSRAERLDTALRQAAAAIKAEYGPTPVELIQLQENLEACRSPETDKPSKKANPWMSRRFTSAR